MSLHLTRSPDQVAGIERLAARLATHGGGRIGLAALLDDLGEGDRRARRRLAPGLAVHRAWRWEHRDDADPDWFPQGIAHSWDTGYAPGAPGVLLVSWYSTRGEGARVSVLDLAEGRYRHVLLVEAAPDGTMRPVRAHAGGLAWHGRWLHVAATRRGLLTFDLEDLLHDPAEELGHAWLLPLRAVHEAGAGTPEERLRHSFLSLDHTEAVPVLVVGEYGRGGHTTRLVRFELSADGALVHDDEGRAVALPLGDGPVQMQGAVVVGDVVHVTISHGRRAWGEVAVGRPGLPDRPGAWGRILFATPPGPEDLTYHPPSDQLWSLSEHPGRRWVFSMRRRRLARLAQVARAAQLLRGKRAS